MEAKAFTVTELCRIIQICRKNNVSEMKLGDFSVSFAPIVKGPGRNPSLQTANTNSSEGRPAAEPTREVLYDKDALEEMRLAQLLIDDPVGFEEREIELQSQAASN